MAWSRMLRRSGRIALAVAVGLGGAWLAFLLFGRSSYQLGPFKVEYFLRPGVSVTEIALPPLGRIRADSHLSPVHFTATLESVDPDGVARSLRRRGVRGLAANIELQALDALRIHVWRWVAIGAAGAVASGLAVYRRRWRPALAAALGGTLLVVAAGGAAWASYRPSAFLEPTFTGSLRLAPGLVGPIRQATNRIEDFRAELSRITQGALGAYAGVIEGQVRTGAAVAILHVSDVHASPIGMDFAQRLSRAFDVDGVVDTGDITSFGTPLERGILSRIGGFEVPYLFIRGNHDSPSIGAAIDGFEGARLVEFENVEVGGLRIYGVPHPLFTPDPEATRDHDEIEAAVEAAGEDLAVSLSALPEPPDILALHDGRMAQAVAGSVPVVLSGHFHEFAEAEEDGTLFLRVGTTGGGGLDTFTREESIPLAAQILYFDGQPLELIAYDRVELDPKSGDLTVDRRLAVEVEEPLPGPTLSP